METKKWYAAIDVHSCGQPLRIITGGLPELPGSTMRDKALFFQQHNDDARKLLMSEPRGHYAMTGAIVTAPVTPEARFGLLFLNQQGLASVSGHGIVASVTAWTVTGQISPSDAAKGILIDCPAGTVRVTADMEGEEVRSVSFRNVPSYEHTERFPVTLQGREITVDVAFSGEFYAVVDMGEFGATSLEPHQLREWAGRIRSEAESRLELQHPQLDWVSGIHGVFFYQRDEREPDQLSFQSACIFAGEQLDRSPGGAGVCAHLAVLNSRGLLEPGQQAVYRGISGARAIGSIAGVSLLSGNRTVIPQLTGTAYILGFMNFVLDPADPLSDGFILY
ncbi:proline racemase [Paenibacillus rhizosphaerae]|uniref:Proline racemase n=1 Tax=Paenibacillus rhizosphaerae TaxID=297318 RepID=A0A839TJQ7_9BACL|nr:proline racemase family protein [Paenibacillus rhizosphaerae]MBB3126901.1 proline racemase [Paenibacillus rhizosphaerae]